MTNGGAVIRWDLQVSGWCDCQCPKTVLLVPVLSPPGLKTRSRDSNHQRSHDLVTSGNVQSGGKISRVISRHLLCIVCHAIILWRTFQGLSENIRYAVLRPGRRDTHIMEAGNWREMILLHGNGTIGTWCQNCGPTTVL